MTEDEERTAHEKAAETRKKRTRAKIIQAAAFVIEDKGLATSFEDVAEEAGISPTTVYSHYGHKWWLFADVFNETFQPLVKKISGSATHQSNEIARREHFIKQLIGLTLENVDLVRGALMAPIDDLQMPGDPIEIGYLLCETAFVTGSPLLSRFHEAMHHPHFWDALGRAILTDIVGTGGTGNPRSSGDWDKTPERLASFEVEQLHRLLDMYCGVACYTVGDDPKPVREELRRRLNAARDEIRSTEWPDPWDSSTKTS